MSDAGGMEDLTPALTIEETLTRWPQAAQVFVARRMACVGCDMSRFDTIADAATAYGIPCPELLRELRRAATATATATEYTDYTE